MLTEAGGIFLFASTHKDLSTRLSRAERRNDDLADENANLRAENARLAQALRDQTTSQTPRAIVTSLGGVLAGAGIELWIKGDAAVGPLLTFVGTIVSAAASWWRTQSSGGKS
jgi:hypothetical protein